MTEQDRSTTPPDAVAPPDWFRGPTVREHRIAAGLFAGFAVFFVLLFVVLSGWWFRWVILALALFSLVTALGHLRDSRDDGARPDAGRDPQNGGP